MTPLRWAAVIIGALLGSWLVAALALVAMAAFCWLAGELGL